MSPQSSSPSQCHRRGTQLELAHWNWVSLHDAATTIWSQRHSPTTIWSQGHSPTTTWSQGHYNNNPESGAPQQQPGVRGTTTTTWSQGHYNNNLESGALQQQPGVRGTTTTTRSQGHPNNNLESGALQQQPGVRGTPTTTWSQGHYNNNLESGAPQQQPGDGGYFYNNLELGGRVISAINNIYNLELGVPQKLGTRGNFTNNLVVGAEMYKWTDVQFTANNE